jgi:hypothetical protein
MIRVLLALAIVAMATASAFAKPKVAILGLEVTGSVDQSATNVAHDLTEGLRARAKSGNGPYTLAPNSDRELIDEKVIKQCENEEPSCMSEIGKDLDADVLSYGKLEKDGGGFQATIVMLDVKTKTTIKTHFVTVPPGASSDDVRSIAKKTYLELAPSASGTSKLVITANVETGSVFVDDELRETLSNGRAMLTLPEGRYRIAIESDGYKRKEITVKLAEEDSATESFELTKRGKSGGGGGIDPWKPIFGVSLVGAVGLGVYSWLQHNKKNDAAKDVIGTNSDGGAITQSDCGETVMTTTQDKFEATCSLYKRHLYTAIAAGGVGALALVAGYIAFIHDGKKEPSSSALSRTRKSSIAITPTLSPEGGGATLRIDW